MINAKWLIIWLYMYLKKEIHLFRIKIAKNEAIRLHRITGKRYHVVPKGNNVQVVDNTFLKKYNKVASKMHLKKISFYELLQMSYFSTQ